MSQHRIVFQSAKHGEVEIILGWDPRLAEFFVKALAEPNEELITESKANAALAEVATLVTEKLGVEIPPDILAAVAKDESDWRAGATDVGRRVTTYEADVLAPTAQRPAAAPSPAASAQPGDGSETGEFPRPRNLGSTG